MVLPEIQRTQKSDSHGLVTIENITYENGLSSLYYIQPIMIYSSIQNFSNLSLSSDLITNINLIINPELRKSQNLHILENYNSFMDGLKALSDMDLINFCFGDILNFSLVTQIGSISLLNETRSSNRYKINEWYFFRLKIYSRSNQPLSLTQISLDFNLVHFPSYMASEYIFVSVDAVKSTTINFQQISNKTDINGEISIKYSNKISFISNIK